jgi:chromosome segregation ATPase
LEKIILRQNVSSSALNDPLALLRFVEDISGTAEVVMKEKESKAKLDSRTADLLKLDEERQRQDGLINGVKDGALRYYQHTVDVIRLEAELQKSYESNLSYLHECDNNLEVSDSERDHLLSQLTASKAQVKAASNEVEELAKVKSFQLTKRATVRRKLSGIALKYTQLEKEESVVQVKRQGMDATCKVLDTEVSDHDCDVYIMDLLMYV